MRSSCSAVTASEPPTGPSGDDRSLTDWALDLFVYLPAGVLATALDDMDEMAEKGRARVDQQLRNAHVIGRFAVDFGLRRLKRDAASLIDARVSRSNKRDRTAERDATMTEPSSEQPAHGPHASSQQAPAPRPRAAPTRDPEVDHAIADYDTLSASQVVRRLDGLDAQELRAVLRHERATRGRRTILHRAEQLLDTSAGAPRDTPAGAPGDTRAP